MKTRSEIVKILKDLLETYHAEEYVIDTIIDELYDMKDSFGRVINDYEVVLLKSEIQSTSRLMYYVGLLVEAIPDTIRLLENGKK